LVDRLTLMLCFRNTLSHCQWHKKAADEASRKRNVSIIWSEKPNGNWVNALKSPFLSLFIETSSKMTWRIWTMTKPNECRIVHVAPQRESLIYVTVILDPSAPSTRNQKSTEREREREKRYQKMMKRENKSKYKWLQRVQNVWTQDQRQWERERTPSRRGNWFTILDHWLIHKPTTNELRHNNNKKGKTTTTASRTTTTILSWFHKRIVSKCLWFFFNSLKEFQFLALLKWAMLSALLLLLLLIVSLVFLCVNVLTQQLIFTVYQIGKFLVCFDLCNDRISQQQDNSC